jgi:uncharacterized membrane protein YuzA (DUF378 family)
MKGGSYKMTWYEKTALALSAVGAINWGFATFNFNLVEKLIGSWSANTATVVYLIVAVCGIYAIVDAFK